MDTSITATANPTPRAEIREKILAIVDEKHGAFWVELYDGLIPEYPVEQAHLAATSLLTDGTLRLREDSEEHDWEYVRATGSNDLKISDAQGMAQDLRGESEWKASNFMGSMNT